MIVVGARCAGSPLAMMLSQAGLKVCLVDRAGFPSDTPSTHGIQPSGVKILDRLGVLERILEAAPAIDDGVLAFDGVRAEFAGITESVGAPMVNIRRVTLDAILLDAAVAAGVEARTGTTVTGLVGSAGRVVGVETTGGPCGRRWSSAPTALVPPSRVSSALASTTARRRAGSSSGPTSKASTRPSAASGSEISAVTASSPVPPTPGSSSPRSSSRSSVGPSCAEIGRRGSRKASRVGRSWPSGSPALGRLGRCG